MTFHTARSPSQSHRFLNCPGALALCASLPKHVINIPSDAGRRGTATHALVERTLKEGSVPESYRDRIIELIGEEESVSILRPGAKLPGRGRVFFIVDSEMIDGAEMATTYVRQRCKELGVAESALQLETRTNPLPERDDTSGTADVTIDAWDVLEVVDYKNGYMTVEHEDNEQLLAYLLGKAIDTGWTHEQYLVTVIQPNASHAEGRVRSFPITKAKLLEFQNRYRVGIEDCELAEAQFEFVKSEQTSLADWARESLFAGDHCLFCDAAPTCPARLALAQDQAQIDFKDAPQKISLEPDVESVARILEWAPQMESLIRSANAFAKATLEAGHAIPRHKLARRGGRRRWIDAARDTLLAKVKKFVPRDLWPKLLGEPEMISGPQAEKLVPAKQRKAFSDALLQAPEGSLTVVPESDPREAVNCNPGDDFDDVAADDFG